jgi:HSP20 family molecular chaperone IbpA
MRERLGRWGQFNFPVDVDMKHLKAKLENGVLMMTLPKKTKAEGTGGRVSIE